MLNGEGLAIHITASFGLATFPQDGADLHSIIRAADTMMYCAKAEGRDRIATTSPERSPEMPRPHTSRHL